MALGAAPQRGDEAHETASQSTIGIPGDQENQFADKDRPVRPLCFAGVVLMVAAGFAEADEPWVRIVAPTAGSFAIGEVVVEAEVFAEQPIDEVRFIIDGHLVGTVTSPPYRITTDLGGDTGAHLFTVMARGEDGSIGEASLSSAPIPVADEVTVQLQQVYATVTRDGVRVNDLSERDFTVSDRGERQEIISFSRGDIPFTAVLMIDASSSMLGARLRAACAGAEAFITAMAELDRAKVLVFSDRILAVSPFSGDSQLLTAELATATAQGGTALNDHLFMALKLLEQQQGRRVIVLLSDGIDSHSVLSMEQVVRKVQQSQALIYWIRLGRHFGGSSAEDDPPRLTSMWRDSESYRRQFEQLRRVVEDSGGYEVVVDSLENVRQVFVEVLRDLREQYAIGYYPSTRSDDGTWHSVRVKVDRFGSDVRTHKGYVDL